MQQQQERCKQNETKQVYDAAIWCCS